MTISSELEAHILRYYHVEKWRVGTIAAQLKVHHSVVTRVLLSTGVRREKWIAQHSIIEPYLPFMLETLNKYPSLRASRLYAMVCERGYPGGPDHFRYLVSLHRPRPRAEAYLRLRTLPGEQGQVDWGHFGYLELGKAKRPLMAFVMVLSFSRKVFLRFYLNARMGCFLAGHEAAFTAFGGVPRVLLYDNLKSAVLERYGEAIRFNLTLLEFAGHYRYEPRPVAVARGNEKGRVERTIRYIRDNFFAARKWCDLQDLNAQATAWCEGSAAQRPCPEDSARTVQAVFEEEQSKLLKLPDNPFDTAEREEVKVAKTPYVRFDLNDYSVPHTHVRRVLTVLATQDTVSIVEGMQTLAQHPRSFDKGQQIEQAEHLQALVEEKQKARLHRGQDRLAAAVPMSKAFLMQAAVHGYSLGLTTANLLKLLERYGAAELAIALEKALEKASPHPNTVRHILIQRRQEREQLPPVALDLPKDPRIRELVVRPHDLKSYDQLQTFTEEASS